MGPRSVDGFSVTNELEARQRAQAPFIPRASGRGGVVVRRGVSFAAPIPVASLNMSPDSFMEGNPALSKVNGRTEEDDNDDTEDDPFLSSMPWSDFQRWALRDNLPRYVVSIPATGVVVDSDDGGRLRPPEMRAYALWRTLTQEVMELAGYDPRYLAAAHAADARRADSVAAAGNDISDDPKSTSLDTPGILPFLDQFEFTPDGGVSGRAYGLPGIADGTSIETSSVSGVEYTVPRGYVRTADGVAAYELGAPAGDFYSLDGTAGSMTEQARKAMLQAVAGAAKAIRAGGLATDSGLARDTTGSGEADAMLVRLGGTTAVLLAGATAMSMLSHHLTVNMFWV